MSLKEQGSHRISIIAFDCFRFSIHTFRVHVDWRRFSIKSDFFQLTSDANNQDKFFSLLSVKSIAPEHCDISYKNLVFLFQIYNSDVTGGRNWRFPEVTLFTLFL